MNAPLRIGLSACLAIAAVWAGAQLYLSRNGVHAERGIPVPVGEVSAPLTTDQQSPLDAEFPTPATVPDAMPAFSLADLDGKATTIDRWRGKSLMINFWATWCAPCRREIPLLQALHAEKAGKDFDIVGIAVDYADKVRAFRDQLKIAYPLLVGEQDALDLVSAVGLKQPAFPFTVFTDRRGQIVTLYLGELKRPEAEAILAVVADVNQDRIDLPAARRLIGERIAALHGKS
jgi:thiol-disulfide isomerase/thioredoxin